MDENMSVTERASQSARLEQVWDKQAPSYDKTMGWFERRILGEDNRAWACGRVKGDTLEVAIGTGLNLPFYGPDVRLVGVDLSPGMLELASKRAAELGRDVDLRQGNAHDLPFDDGSFDTVVCVYSLCNIPDIDRALGEMARVLRDDGRLILVDHVRSRSRLVYVIQKLIEVVSLRSDGDHQTRRPFDHLADHGFEVAERDRFKWGGLVERLAARKR